MLKKTFQLALLTTALFASAAPALAAQITISGNGADSTNTASVNLTKETTIFQTNTANVGNNVSVTPSTGNNTASQNTGGSTTISTGDASGNVSANTNVNKNTASLSCCGLDGVSANVSGNGADSSNSINLTLNNSTTVTDQKTLNIKNNFNVDPTTGGNKADENTGGNTRISTGDASATVTIGNSGNFDTVIIGAVVPPVTPPVPGTNPIPNPPVVVASNPGNVLAAASLPNTGFNATGLLLTILGMVGAGAFLRSQTGNAELLG